MRVSIRMYMLWVFSYVYAMGGKQGSVRLSLNDLTCFGIGSVEKTTCSVVVLV